jgi:hypothetical protein
MEKKPAPQSGAAGRTFGEDGSPSPRVLIALLACAAAACLALSGTQLASLRPEAPTKGSQRTLTFAERVSYQRGIEEVYWRHRIWPKQSHDPKPSLDVVTPRDQIEKKVEDYLRNSQELEDYWQRPITSEQLQAEMDRMAQHTKQPQILREVFQALGNDPFVIAECLARPGLAQRLITEFNNEKHARLTKAALQSLVANAETPITTALSRNYKLPTILSPSGACIDDTWTPTTTTDAPSPRGYHTAVWTGTEMIVWGGFDGTNYLNTGGRYDPVTDSWTATGTTNAPDARRYHTAVWTGTEMFVWGGSSNAGYFNTGGRYDPVTNTWTATSTTNAPSARDQLIGLYITVPTTSGVLVWGGSNGAPLNTGGYYMPGTDTWTTVCTTNAPSPRVSHTGVSTGAQMIVWGGAAFPTYFNDGGRYCAVSGATPTPTPTPTATPTATATATPTSPPLGCCQLERSCLDGVTREQCLDQQHGFAWREGGVCLNGVCSRPRPTRAQRPTPRPRPAP